MAAFAQFASDLDASTQQLLARGSRLTELLKQPQYKPLPVEEQVVAIFAGVRGYLDKFAEARIGAFEASVYQPDLRSDPSIMEAIRVDGELESRIPEKKRRSWMISRERSRKGYDECPV